MANTDKELEKIYAELREMKIDTPESSSSGGKRRRISSTNENDDLLTFFIGLLMLAGGLFMIFNNLVVTSSWRSRGYFFSIGSFHVPNGMIMLPIIVGIMMLFLMRRKVFGWAVVAIGIVIVLLNVLLTTDIYWRNTSAYIFIIMFGLTAAGGGIVLRELFRNRD